MLIKYFIESKKFLNEKNAKLEVSYKKRKLNAKRLEKGYFFNRKESKLSGLGGGVVESKGEEELSENESSEESLMEMDESLDNNENDDG